VADLLRRDLGSGIRAGRLFTHPFLLRASIWLVGSLGAVRRWTFITIIALFVVIGLAAAYQILIASRDAAPLPGPVPGHPLPTATATTP
jgi:hypothetical protein